MSSPAVVGDLVYVTTEDNRAVALNRDTGHQVWEYPTDIPSSSTPAVAGEFVFIALRDGRVIALDSASGDLRWERDLGEPLLASPIVADGTVYIGSTNKKLYALDAATGRERWSFTVQGWITSPVAYTENMVAVASQDNLLYIIDTKTGRKRLDCDVGRPILGGPAIREDRMFFVSSQGLVWSVNRNTITYPFERTWWHIKTNLFAWGLISGVPIQKWSAWATRIDGRIGFSPAIAHDRVYVATTESKLIALEADTDEKQERDTSTLVPELTSEVNTPHEESARIEPYFWGPISVKLDDEGRLYVTESNRHRIQIYQKVF